MSGLWHMTVHGCDDSVTLTSKEQPSADVVAFAKLVNANSLDRCQPSISLFRTPEGHKEWDCPACQATLCQQIVHLADPDDSEHERSSALSQPSSSS